MFRKIKRFLMVLLLMVIPSISLVSVNADEVDSYVVKYDSLISDDLNYLGYSDYVCDNSLEILTFSLGVDLNDKMLMYMYVYSDNDLSFYDITLKTTSCTDGLSSFSDTYSYVSKDENIYKFIYKKSNQVNSLYTLISNCEYYEFNIDCLYIGENIFNEQNGGYFEQRFYIQRSKVSDGVFLYFVKAINNSVITVNADYGVRRLEGEPNFFNSVLFSGEVRDLFYICFDVFLNDNKVLYDFYQIDLEYDIEYVKYVQNVGDWDNPIHVSLSKEVLSSNHYSESIISKDTVLSFKEYNWFGEDSWFFRDVSVEFNTLCSMEYAESKNYLADGFISDKSYVLFFGDVENGYKYEKGSVVSVPDCSYVFNDDPSVVSYGYNVCSHIDVWEYRPKNIEFVTLYYRVNGFEYKVDVDEQYLQNLGVSDVGPGSNVETSGGISEIVLKALSDFFAPLIDFFDSIGEKINRFRLIILIIVVVILLCLLWNPLVGIFKFIWLILKFIWKIICFPFKMIGRFFKKIFKKKEYSNKVNKYQDKGGW